MHQNNFIIPKVAGINFHENEDYYSNVLENLPAAVYTCDNDGYIKFYNKAAAKLWGREPEIGKDLCVVHGKFLILTGLIAL